MLIILTLLCWHANTIQSTARADGNFFVVIFVYLIMTQAIGHTENILMMALKVKIRGYQSN